MKGLLNKMVGLVPCSIRGKLISRYRNSKLINFYSRHVVGRSNMYSRDFIEDNSSTENVRTARALAQEIYGIFKPSSVIDIGCGAGNLIGSFRDIGAKVMGVDFSEHSGAEAKRRGIPFLRLDLEKDSDMDAFEAKAELVTCLEVAEHLPESRAMPLVAFLSRVAPIVCFSAATPGQGGILHLNERPSGYWQKLFEEVGMLRAYDAEARLIKFWKEQGIEDPRVRNFMLLRKSERADL